jgi:hypothetical protein
MKKNGKLTAAFIIVGLLALVMGAGGIALIWYAGDFDRYFYEDYQIYMIALAAAAVFTFILACCLAAGLSSAYRKSYAQLAYRINKAEQAAAQAQQAPPVPVVQAPAPVVAPVPVAEPEVSEAPPEPEASEEFLVAIGRIQVYASELQELAAQGETTDSDDAANQINVPDKATVRAMVDEIDDIAFRAHLLSLNIAIETSNSGNAEELAAITEEVQNLENMSASVAGRCTAVFGAAGSPESSSDGVAQREERIRELADKITKETGRFLVEELAGRPSEVNDTVVEPEKPEIVSPIDTTLSGGLY